MSANSENSAVATGLEKGSSHSNPKEQWRQRMFKLPYKFHSFHIVPNAFEQSDAQNLSSQASAVHELRTSRCTSWVSKKQRNQRPNCQHSLDHGKSKGVLEKHLLHWLLKPLTVWITTNSGKLLKNFICLLRNLYAGQEATVRTRHETTGSKLGKA